MNIKELIIYTEKQMKEKPNWFLFRENEPKVSPENVAVLETGFSAKLPFSYVEFQKHFGGGTFAFTELFSLSPKSEYFILNEFQKHSSFPKIFFPISSDGTGGFYGFVKEDTIFSEKIYYLETESEKPVFRETQWNFIGFFLWSAFNI